MFRMAIIFRTFFQVYSKLDSTLWRTSLSSIDTRSQDVNSCPMSSSLNKTKSDTGLNDGYRAGNPSKPKFPNLTLTRALAKIDNTYDRARVATRQEEAKRKTLLYQRKVSAEIKVAQLQKVLRETTKDKTYWPHRGSKTPQPLATANIEETVKVLTDELQDIEENWKATTEKQEWTMKEMEASKTKNTTALRLLMAATEDLLHNSDPEDYAQSPDRDPSTPPSLHESKASKTDDNIPSLKRDKTLKWKPSIFRLPRLSPSQSRRGSDTSTASLQKSKTIKNNSFRMLFKPNTMNTDKETGHNDTLVSQQEFGLPTKGSKEPSKSSKDTFSSKGHIRGSKETKSTKPKGIVSQKNKVFKGSSTTSSSDESEIRTEVSREALYEILVRFDLMTKKFQQFLSE